MRPITRYLLSLTLVLLLASTYFSSQSAYAFQSNQTEEPALRSLVERLYVSYANKDVEAYFSQWSSRSVAAERRRDVLRRAFVTLEKVEIKKLTFTQLKIETDKAEIRIVLELDFVRRGNLQHQIMNRLITCVRESAEWKAMSDLVLEEDLAAKLAAEKNDEERLALLAAAGDWSAQILAESLPAQASQLAARGEFNQAIALCQLMKKLGEQVADERLQARAMDLIGSFQQTQGDFVSALASYRQSLEILKRMNFAEGIFALQNNLGWVLADMGDYDAAIAAFQQSLKLADSGDGDKLKLAVVLTNIANAYRSAGNYAKALQHVNQSLELSRALGDKGRQAIAQNTLAGIYLAQGENDLAEIHFRQSLALHEQSGEKSGLADTLSNVGAVLSKKGNYDEALKLYQRSLELRATQRDKAGQATVLANIGDVYRRRRLHDQAMEFYRQSLVLHEKLGSPDKIARVLSNIARLYAEQKNYQQALPAIERAVTLAGQSGDRDLFYRASNDAGKIYYLLNRLADAGRAFGEAIAAIEELRSQVAGGEQQQERFFESKTSSYLGMARLFLDEQKPVAALGYAERAKSRVLLDVLQSGRVGIAKAMTESEREREKLLGDEIASLNTQLYRENLRRSPDAIRLADLNSRLQKARADWEVFQTSLYAAHPELQTQRGRAPQFDLNAVASSLLDSQTALMEYVVAEDKTYLFVITQEAGKQAAPLLKFYEAAISHDKLNEAVEAFRRQLADHDLTFGAAAKQLHELLIKPAAVQLRGKTKLVIVRDAGLWELPFQALKNDAGRYLVEDFAVSYAPSLMALAEMTRLQRHRKSSSGKNDLLAFGNPAFGTDSGNDAQRGTAKFSNLPSAENEVTQLGKLYGSPIYIGAQATEQRFKAEAGKATVLHLATHGVLNNASPMYSQIVLAQLKDGEKNSEDGLLEAWEVMKLDLQADLVVLSACETGRGRIGAGEGLIGLTWAFFVAGAPTTVVSQWKVDAESTSELMQEFHRGLRQATPASRSKAEALRAAELKLLRNPKYRHPFYWASFSVIGVSR